MKRLNKSLRFFPLQNALRIPILISLFLLLFIGTLSGCSSTRTSTTSYQIETGDVVGITVNASEGYSQTQEVPFEIRKNDNLIFMGHFIHIDSYEDYLENLKETAQTVESTGSEVLLEDNGHYTCLIKLEDTETVVILESEAELDEIKACLDSTSFFKQSTGGNHE